MSLSISFFGFVLLAVLLIMFKGTVKKVANTFDNAVEVADDAVQQFAVEQKIQNRKKLNELLTDYEVSEKPAMTAAELLKELR